MPAKWREVFNQHEAKWIGNALYHSKGVPKEDLKLWYDPPPPRFKPHPDEFFTKKLMVWAPQKQFKLDLMCPECPNQKLVSKGFYGTVRTVVSLQECYNLVTWYLKCPACLSTFPAWALNILKQLPPECRQEFPAIVTFKSTCDISVVRLLRDRHIGNSPSAVHRMLEEGHSEMWLSTSVKYLAQCKTYKQSIEGRMDGNGPIPFLPPPKFQGLGDHRWLLRCYSMDVYQRLEELKRGILGTFGTIIKVDSTKKVSTIKCE